MSGPGQFGGTGGQGRPPGDPRHLPVGIGPALGFLRREFSKQKGLAATLVAVSIARQALPLTMLTAPLWIESSLSSASKGQSGPSFLLTVSLVVAATLLFPLSLWAGARIGLTISIRLRSSIFAKYGRMGTSELASASVGERALRTTEDVGRLQSFLSDNAPEGFALLAQAVASSTVLTIVLSRNPIPGVTLPRVVLAFVAFFAAYLGLRHLQRKVSVLQQDFRRCMEQAMTQFIEGLSGSRDLIATGRFADAVTKYRATLSTAGSFYVRQTLFRGLSAFLPSVVGILIVLGLYFVSTSDPARAGGNMQSGALLSVGGILLQLMQLPQQFANFRGVLSMLGPSIAAIESLEAAPEPRYGERNEVPKSLTLEFRNVRLAFGPNARPVLDGLSLSVPEGMFLALIGQSGSGKSTLMNCALRFVEPQSGEILVGGVPIQELSADCLRRTVGIIPQTPFLFDGTIRDNILLGLARSPEVDAEVDEVVRLSNLQELVRRRSKEGGLDARVGAGGSTLSGGERQRIALARVLLRKPKILFCDEYVANIDNATARLIQEALHKEFKGSIRIVASHQLYALRGADRIAVLEAGKVSYSGTHEELVARPGLYKDLWDLQRIG